MAAHDPHRVSSGEHGVVRVFTTDLEPQGDAAITARNVAKILGQDVTLDPRYVEVFPSRAVEGLGLAAYLAQGYDIPEQAMAGKAAALDALSGLTILIRSPAFGGREQMLDPNPGLRFIGAFREADTAPPVRMPHTGSAEGRLATPPTRVDPRQSGVRRASWAVALGALVIAATLVLVAVF